MNLLKKWWFWLIVVIIILGFIPIWKMCISSGGGCLYETSWEVFFRWIWFKVLGL